MSNNTTVAQIILEHCRLWGVKNIYGVAGDAILSLLDAIAQQKNIRYTDVHHESSAAFMASTEGKCTQQIGVCIGTSGPGLVNMINGIADAAADHIPMLVISGQVETRKTRTETKQYINQQQMIHPLAVFSTQVIHPDAIVDALQQAFIQATTLRGVAHISVPKELFNAFSTQTPRGSIGLLNHPDSVPKNISQLDQASLSLRAAHKPMMLIGEGARMVGSEVVQLAETLQAGIIETLGAKGTIAYDHPLLIGGIGNGGTTESQQLLHEADCVLVVGANYWPEDFVPQQTQIIQIDISPANIEGHKEVVCGLVGDAQDILPMLRQRVQEQQTYQPIDRHAWETRVQQTKAVILSQFERERTMASADELSPQQLMTTLDTHVDANAIIVLDTGDHTLWFNRNFRAKQQSVLFSGKWRTMGYALPSAIAAKMIYPDKQVVAIVGDGGMSMTMLELLTAVKHNISLTVIVVNNQTLALEKHKMIKEGSQPFGVDLTNPHFAQAAQSFGALGKRVHTQQELSATLEETKNENLPVCIEVMTTDEMIPTMNPSLAFVETSAQSIEEIRS